MRIRNRILIYFVSAVTILAAVSLSTVFILFSEYREEEFQQRQKSKIYLTISLVSKYKEDSETLSQTIDQMNINDFFDEKLLIYDGKKKLIFSSIDNLSIQDSQLILNQLSPELSWIETKEDKYDVIGVYYDSEGKSYYAISKAFDEFGYTKLDFLKNTLILIFLGILLTVVIISFFISSKLAKPIVQFSNDIRNINFSDSESQLLKLTPSGSLEIDQLYERFNNLLNRTNESILFQKHAVQHISHELKTPITVLVSEIERLKTEVENKNIADQLAELAFKAKFLGEIIHSLLQISKIETGQEVEKRLFRIDELIFDVLEDMRIINPDFSFEFQINQQTELLDEKQLELRQNPVLIKQVIQNLLSNCISYSENGSAKIEIDWASEKAIIVRFINLGPTLSEEEQLLLFEHFFRGKNSQGKIGFGLGLVLSKKIIQLSGGSIHYKSLFPNINTFEIELPLS